jgi:GIY-YIG catalytic domain-containing protein
VTRSGNGADAVIAALSGPPVAPTGLAAQVPRAPGLYAWWAHPAVLPAMTGPAHPADDGLRLLYVGLATALRSRLGQHTRRTGSSTLRRTLAGLLLDAEGYRTRWTDRVVLVDADEARLTAWMTENLRVSWCTHPDPGAVEGEVIRRLRPPLNVDHASGPLRDAVRSARKRYQDTAGPPP